MRTPRDARRSAGSHGDGRDLLGGPQPTLLAEASSYCHNRVLATAQRTRGDMCGRVWILTSEHWATDELAPPALPRAEPDDRQTGQHHRDRKCRHGGRRLIMLVQQAADVTSANAKPKQR